MSQFTITLNGDPRRVPAPLTLAGLLAHLGLGPLEIALGLAHR